MARSLALVGMARELAPADVNAVRTGISTELRKLYSGVLREEIPERMAELIKQLDQLMEAKPRNRSTDDP
jgi:Anti-sigma factor NepR